MSRLRTLIRKAGIRPRKSLGQSFLEDEGVIQRIVQCAHIDAGDTVIEIGAGLGMMTEAVAHCAERVVAVEIDPTLVRTLDTRLRALRNIEILAGDILRCDLDRMAVQFGLKPPYKVVGNVPYHISRPILFKMLDDRTRISAMCLMLQREVADRLIANSGTRAYGILSVLMDMYAEMNKEFDVPPECFFPRPRVWSTVLTFRMRGDAKYSIRNLEAFRAIVKCAFSHRRKTIFNNLRHADWLNLSPEALRQRLVDAGIDPGRRAETLDTQEYARITDVLTVQKCA